MSRHQETSDQKQAVSASVHHQVFTQPCKQLNSGAENKVVKLAMIADYFLSSEDLSLKKYEFIIDFYFIFLKLDES